VLGKGPHHVVEALAHQNHIPSAFFRNAGSQALDTLLLQLFFQDVFEILFAQRIQPVARNSR
jgi:hypothetical protein